MCFHPTKYDYMFVKKQQQIASDMFLPNLLIVEDIDIKLGTHVYCILTIT